MENSNVFTSLLEEIINSISRADAGLLFLYDNREKVLSVASAVGFSYNEVSQMRVKPGESIAGKTFQFIAMRKPTVTGDNPANRELFEHRKNAFIIEMANAEALADAILELKNNEVLRRRIAEEGYKTFNKRSKPIIIGKNISIFP